MNIDIDIIPHLKKLKNWEKIELIEDILGTIDEDGIIDEIRKSGK